MTKAICSMDGCESHVVGRGYCGRHYKRLTVHGDPNVNLARRKDPDAKCSVEDCDRPRFSNGWCAMHHQRVLRRGTTELRVFPKVCAVEDCDRAVKARGYCPMHYNRLKVHGDANWKPRRNVCSVGSCTDRVRAWGLCSKHFERMKRNGTTDLLAYKPGTWNPGADETPMCVVSFCERPQTHTEPGLCSAHYQQARKGKPFTATRATRPGGRATCSADGCNAQHLALGLCSTHHARLRKYGLTPEDFDALFASQGSRCATCHSAEGGTRNWHVDHDHDCCPGWVSCGKCVRGILCKPCNMALGILHDDADTLRRMADYLRVR